MRLIKNLLLPTCCCLLFSTRAMAYPNAVVFAPTGETKKNGETNAYLLTSMNYLPTLGMGFTWLGANIGFLNPSGADDQSTHFGGLEAGFDLIYPATYPGENQSVKPVLNLKVQILTETAQIPHIAIGLMDFSPLRINRGSNIVYLALTKRLSMSKDLGRLTLGFGNSFSKDPNLFFGTAPFTGQSQLLLGGYESPVFDSWSFGIDYLGGVSESSSTNIMINKLLPQGSELSLGIFLSNDPTVPIYNYDGIFLSFSKTWNIFGK